MSGPHEKLSDLERLLASLPPKPAALDRDRLLFRAGQASMRRNRLWPWATAAMSAAAACLTLVLVTRPMPAPEVRIVHVQVPVPIPANPATNVNVATDAQANPPFTSSTEAVSSAMSYLHLRDQAIRFGAEGLPTNSANGDEAPSQARPDGPELSAGARPKMIENSSWFPFGEQ